MTQLTLADWQTRAAAVQFEGRAFINGAYTAPASGRSFPTRNPATRQILCQVAECAAADVDAAVSAAREAFNRGVWADLAPMARKRVLLRFAELIRAHRDELALLEDTAQVMLKYPTVPCTECQYCMPCPYGLDIPGILLHFNKCINEGRMPSSSRVMFGYTSVYEPSR